MKFRILLLMLCLATFSVCTAQAPPPPSQPDTEAADQVVIVDLAGFTQVSDIVEEIAMDEDAPGLLAVNAQPAGEVQPFKRNPPTTSFDEDYPEPDPGLMASNLQLPDGDDDPDPNDPFEFPEWLRTFIVGLIPDSVVGWVLSVYTAIGFIVRLTATEKDDEWYMWGFRLLDWLFPNRKIGGGRHPRI